MEMKSNFNVQLPVELFEEWLKKEGLQDGYVLENQEIKVASSKFNDQTGYVEISGDIISRLDS